MRKMLFLSIMFISFAVFASEPDAIINNFLSRQVYNTPSAKVSCVCQMGQQPLVQKWFFKKGCEIWLDEQTGCDEKRILNENLYSQAEYKGINLDSQFQNGLLKLGYVGHWGAGAESYHYFRTVVVPTIEKYKVSVVWDNSGCSGLNAPESILNLSYMQEDLNYKVKLIEHKYQISRLQLDLNFKKSGRENEQTLNVIRQKIEELQKKPPPPPAAYPVLFRAVQVKSIGIWDRKFNPKSNLWAFVDFQKREVSYPTCQEFEGQDCTLAFQASESGKCRNSNGEIESIICCEQRNALQTEDGGSNPTAQWKLKTDCRK